MLTAVPFSFSGGGRGGGNLTKNVKNYVVQTVKYMMSQFKRFPPRRLEADNDNQDGGKIFVNLRGKISASRNPVVSFRLN